jgi:ribonuclease HI
MIIEKDYNEERTGYFPHRIWETEDNIKMKIFTDGSKITNADGLNIAEYAKYNATTKKEKLGRIKGKQDNFRAELTLIMRAIQISKKEQKIKIIIDSIQCIESKIKRNIESERTLNKNKILNGDILEQIKDELLERKENIQFI